MKQLWCVRLADGQWAADTLAYTRKESKAAAERFYAVTWANLRREGCRCVKVRVVEGWE